MELGAPCVASHEKNPHAGAGGEQGTGSLRHNGTVEREDDHVGTSAVARA